MKWTHAPNVDRFGTLSMSMNHDGANGAALNAPGAVSEKYLNDARALGLADQNHRLYERQFLIWPELDNCVFPRPEGYDEWRAANPSHKSPLEKHSAMLSGPEVLALYEAISFSMFRYRRAMNCDFVFLWKAMGLTNPQKIVKLLGEFNFEAARFLKSKNLCADPARPSGGCGYASESDFVYVYVHGNFGDPAKDLHTCQLFYVPPEIHDEFFKWSGSFFDKRRPSTWRSEKAVRARHLRSQQHEAQFEICWRWFRFITRQLSARWTIIDPETGRALDLRDIFQVDDQERRYPLPISKAIGWSENIGRRVRQEENFRSAYGVDRLDKLYDGHEIWDLERKPWGWPASAT